MNTTPAAQAAATLTAGKKSSAKSRATPSKNARPTATKTVASRKGAVASAKAKAKLSAKVKKAPAVKSTPLVSTDPVGSKKSAPKTKLVRDSFTLPEADHDLIKQCKKSAIAGGRETKKSEVVRAAIRVFSELSPSAQLAAYSRLQAIAVGRPKAK